MFVCMRSKAVRQGCYHRWGRLVPERTISTLLHRLQKAKSLPSDSSILMVKQTIKKKKKLNESSVRRLLVDDNY